MISNPGLVSFFNLDTFCKPLDILRLQRSFFCLFVLGKYLDITSGNSPWTANNNSNKWFVVCVLEAWSQSGAFRPDVVTTLYETLKSYYETISTGTETTLEVGIVWSFCFELTCCK